MGASFFSITGLGVVAVASCEEEPPANVMMNRAFDQTLRTVVKPKKRVWRMTTTELTLAQFNSFLAQVDSGATITCTGDFLESGSLSGKVELLGKAYLTSDQMRRVQEFRLHEI